MAVTKEPRKAWGGHKVTLIYSQQSFDSEQSDSTDALIWETLEKLWCFEKKY